MNINFTEKEYRLLLDAIYVADWVMTSHEADRESDDDAHQMLFQKIYSHAREMGCADLVEDAKDDNRYYPTRDYEEQSGVIEWIEEYDAMSFWEELIERLTERDVLQELPAAERERLGAEEYWKRSAPYEQKYATEFEKHGIERLVIDESRKPGRL